VAQNPLASFNRAMMTRPEENLLSLFSGGQLPAVVLASPFMPRPSSAIYDSSWDGGRAVGPLSHFQPSRPPGAAIGSISGTLLTFLLYWARSVFTSSTNKHFIPLSLER